MSGQVYYSAEVVAHVWVVQGGKLLTYVHVSHGYFNIQVQVTVLGGSISCLQCDSHGPTSRLWPSNIPDLT